MPYTNFSLQINFTPYIVDDFLAQRDTWLAFTVILGIIFLVLTCLFIFLRQVDIILDAICLNYLIKEDPDRDRADRTGQQGGGADVLQLVLPNHSLPATAGGGGLVPSYSAPPVFLGHAGVPGGHQE